ncbi:MAG: UDP-N-acetylmuramoyl-tripeptide--D-alanyl-D-alanine ligase [Rickettsiales bacterium]|jgi:UDP-N-acetylmuramoyl-tripeptide--D-alanyl-D-alanine ligase
MASQESLWSISEIKLALKDQIISVGKIESAINQVVIDSRSKTDNGLFVAFEGEFNDGHDYLHSAFDNGCVAAIVDKIPEQFAGDQRLILVKNSLEALDQLAIFSRNRISGKIIAVTGSAGKTSVKEMLKKVFSSQGKTFGTVGNFNNRFGLPVSLCNMPRDVDFGVLEMGMSYAGELTKLSKIARPHIAIITNVCAAHIGNFENEEGIALAKSEIFVGLVEGGFALINADNIHFGFLKKQALEVKIPTENIISFGSNAISDVKLLSISEAENFCSEVDILLTKKDKKINYVVNSISRTTIANSLIAISCLNLIGKYFLRGLKVFKNLETPKGRGNTIHVEKNNIKFTIIDDSYNANSSSMKAGLQYLCDLKNHQNKSRSIAFIGDMLELGKFSDKEHREIVDHVIDLNIDLVLLVGEEMQKLTTHLNSKKLIGNFANSSEACEDIDFIPQNGDIIFVKGSRGIGMEKLIEKILK